ncbi:protein MpPKC2 [Marchantia polymorpha subsp. ruderalis]|nr:hypothetical protein MARPO_0021s0121 [Marchantia polymorpha]BBN01341.1 hypothetical protein Mp_2g06680 [Marchantia polymorpha subsp. ruderalis]|eukprot:PTQ44267.1 hypothetical protein MARPO_0021s0121 [Marchantia polymorpha]
MAERLKMWGGGVALTIEVPIEEAWDALGDFCDISKCLTLDDSERSTYEGERNSPGCIRHVIRRVEWAKEELVAIDSRKHSLKYKMLENGFGFTTYEASIKLKQVSDKKTAVSWTVNMAPVAGKTESEILTNKMCKAFAHGIKKVEADYQKRVALSSL